MKKFILLYVGPATPMDQISEEQGQKINAGWQEWMQKAGDAITDMGAPMANGKSVTDDGSVGTPLQVNGYTFIQAEDMDGALALVEGHPFLSDKTGEFSVQVFELMPRQM